MPFWNRRKNTPTTCLTSLSLETLEKRELLSVNSIAFESGRTAQFVDADGTRVSVKLIGPGEGTIDLTNGLLTGGDIDTLSLNGTTGRSQLKITTKGGAIEGTTINVLAIDNALNELDALNKLVAPSLDFIAGGQFSADGHIADVAIRDLGAGAEFNLAGNVRRFEARSLDGATIDISGKIQTLLAEHIVAGAHVSANRIDSLAVRQRAFDATFDVGAGGLKSADFRHLRHTTISSLGNIGQVVVDGDMVATSVVSNVNAGSDDVYGTIDDYVSDSSMTGNIQSVRLRGAAGTGPNDGLKFVASGSIGNVNLGANNLGAEPFIWQQAASQNIPIDVLSTAINAHGFSDSEIWVALFGQDIPTPPPGVSETGPTYFLDPTTISGGTAHRTISNSTTLPVSASTPDLAILPSATLATWGSALNLHAPGPGRQFTGRIIISAGAPVQAQVNSDGSVSSPSASNLTDPSTGTFYDFLEFTVTNNSGVINLDVDTTQVDSFGMPIGLQFFTDTSGTAFTVPVTGTAVTGSAVISGVNTTGISVGQPIFGGALPAEGARIISLVQSAGGSANGSLTLSQNYPTQSQIPVAVSLTVYPAGPVGVIAPRDTIFTGGTTQQLLQFIKNKLVDDNELARPFLQTAAPYPSLAPIPITFAANVSGETVITTDSTEHLLAGYQIMISGVTGYVGANGMQSVGQVLSSTQFTLAGPAGSGTYVAGGTWSMLITGAETDTTAPGDPIKIYAWGTMGLENGDLVEISGVQGNTAANGFFFVSNVAARSFTLDNSTSNGTFAIGGGSFKIYQAGNRLASPKDIVESLSGPFSTNGLNNYFNKAIDDFFWKYYKAGSPDPTNFQPLMLTSAVNGLTYQGVVTNQNTENDGYVLRMTSSVDSYDIFYPFFWSNTPADATPAFGTAIAPLWIRQQMQEAESPSQMVFACDAVFADNISRGLTGVPSSILGDLEDSISAALNRGIAMNDPSTWSDSTTWYPEGQAYNYWVEYWHQSGLTQSDLAYAFPYDDKFGTSTNLNENNVGEVQITLGSWSSAATGTTTSFVSPPSSATFQSPISLTAKVVDANSQPVTSGTIAFYVNGIAFNRNDSSAGPPMQSVAVNSQGEAAITAIVPALPDGTTDHSYTITAVYSGDGGVNLPSLAYQLLAFTT